MNGQRVGAAVRAVRLRRHLRQDDLARLTGLSTATISRIEHGHFDRLSIATVERVAGTLEIRLDLVARWRGGDLDRLVNARHSALHELVARWFTRMPAWAVRPEISFSIYGERGVIDVLSWHADRRAILAIELKTELVDINELMGTLDRKRRLSRTIARDLGWDAAEASAWVIVAESRTNRRRIAAHEAVLRTAFPADGPAMRRWLHDPEGPIAGLSTWPGNPGAVRRVRRVSAGR